MSAIRFALNVWLTGSIGWSLLTLWRMDVSPLVFTACLTLLTCAAWLTARWPGRFAVSVATVVFLLSTALYADLPQAASVLNWLSRLQLDFAATVAAWRGGDPAVPQGQIATVLLAAATYCFSLLAWLSGTRPRRALTTAAIGGLILSVEWLVHHDAAVIAAAYFLPAALTQMAAARAADLTGTVAAAEPGVLQTAPLPADGRAGSRPPGFSWVHVRIVALAVLAALLLTGAGLVLPADYATADLGVWRERLQDRVPLLADLRGTALRRMALSFDLQQLGYGGSDDELGGPVRTTDAVALNVAVRGADLPGSLYLRGRSPSYYTGRGWAPGAEQPVRTSLDAPPTAFSSAVSQTSLFADVQPQGLRTRTLFTVLEPIRVQTTGEVTWLADHTASGSPAPNSGDTYTVIARQPLYSTEEIYELTAVAGLGTSSIPDEYLSVPVALPDRIARLAADVTAAYDHPYDRIVAIEDYLRGYEYDLEAARPPAGADFVDHFLFEQQAGYCVYHATAMTVMLRTLGIPARYVTGFRIDVGGLPGRFEVRNEMAHAWVEAYLPGYGWVTFEPTPAFPVPDRSYTRDETPLETGATPGPQTPTPPALPVGPLPDDFDGGLGASGGGSATDPDRASRLAWQGSIIALLIAAGAWVTRVIAADRGPRTGTADSPLAIFGLATALFARSGVADGPGLTASERIGGAARRWPSLREPLQTLLGLYLPVRYGSEAAAQADDRATGGDDAAALKAWRLVRNGVRKYQGSLRYYVRLLRQRLLSIWKWRRGGGPSAT